MDKQHNQARVKPDIHEAIREYTRGPGQDSEALLMKLDGAIREYGQPERFAIGRLANREGAALLEAIFIDVIRAWPSREKGKAARALRDFALRLARAYGIPMDAGNLPLDIPDMTQRRLDMLKFLQVPRTLRELEARYLTSERTLRDDLNALTMGWDILGSRVRIQRVDRGRKITYNSTVHPVLLPLNLTEAYALAVAMPALAQLSGPAAAVLTRAHPDAPAAGLPGHPHYRQELPMLEQSRENWLLYLYKRAQRCRLTWKTPEGEVRRAEGRLVLDPSDLGQLVLAEMGKEEVRVALPDLILVEPLEAYQ